MSGQGTFGEKTVTVVAIDDSNNTLLRTVTMKTEDWSIVLSEARKYFKELGWHVLECKRHIKDIKLDLISYSKEEG